MIRMNDSLEKLLPTAQGHTSISELEVVHLTRFNHHLQKQCLLIVEIPSILSTSLSLPRDLPPIFWGEPLMDFVCTPQTLLMVASL